MSGMCVSVSLSFFLLPDLCSVFCCLICRFCSPAITSLLAKQFLNNSTNQFTIIQQLSSVLEKHYLLNKSQRFFFLLLGQHTRTLDLISKFSTSLSFPITDVCYATKNIKGNLNIQVNIHIQILFKSCSKPSSCAAFQHVCLNHHWQ